MKTATSISSVSMTSRSTFSSDFVIGGAARHPPATSDAARHYRDPPARSPAPPAPPRTPDPAPLISPMARDRLHSLTPRLEFLDATLRMVHTYTRVHICVYRWRLSQSWGGHLSRVIIECASTEVRSHWRTFSTFFFGLNCKRSFPLLVVSRATT